MITKVNDEWRMVEEQHLNKDQLETVKELISDQANEIKNSQETMDLITWMKQMNIELAGKSRNELFEQSGNLKNELKDVINENKEGVKEGFYGILKSVKKGVAEGSKDIKKIFKEGE